MSLQNNEHNLYLKQVARIHKDKIDLPELMAKVKLKADELELWERVFNALPAWISIQDKDYNLVKINKAFAAAMLKLPEELIGRKCYEVIHGTSEPFAKCPHQKVLETGYPVCTEFYDPRLQAYLQVSMAPIYDKEHKIIGTVHIVNDISELRMTEDAKDELIKILQESREKVKILSGLLPICSACYKIRDRQGNWTRLEQYIADHSEADFTHTFCPECIKKHFPAFSDPAPNA